MAYRLLWPLVFAVALVAVHLAATRGTGVLPDAVREQFGASAATVASRPWAQATAFWFHRSWGHLAYNLAVLLAATPWAVGAYGPRVVLLGMLASVLAGFLVDLLLILPLAAAGLSHAADHAAHRLVGASVVAFAGAGMAWTAWDGVGWLRAAAFAGFVLLEVGLAVLGATRPWVWAFHVAGGALGVGFGLALRR